MTQPNRLSFQSSRSHRALIMAFGALGFALTPTLFFARGQDLPGGKEGWIPLFNGKDLTGWKPKIKGHDSGDNFGNTFRVEDGILKVGYDQYPQFDSQFGHLFSEHKYSNYRLGSSIGLSATSARAAPGGRIKTAA